MKIFCSDLVLSRFHYSLALTNLSIGQTWVVEGTVLIWSEDYWFSCHATGLIQVVPLTTDRLKAFEHGTVRAEVVPGTFVLIPDVMDHHSGTVEPVPLITVLLPFVRDVFPGAIIFIETPTAIFLLPASLNCNGC